MNQYDTTVLQTKTCENIAKLIKDTIDYLIEGKQKNNIKKKREIFLSLGHYMYQYNEAKKLMYDGCGGTKRLERNVVNKIN